MYGLPKIHKEGVPVRPIISACGTYNFRLAKYLDQILKPLIPTKNYINAKLCDFGMCCKFEPNVEPKLNLGQNII